MGAFFGGLWAFFKAAPALFALYKEIKKILEYANEKVDSARRAKELKDGLEFARKTKNTRELERIFRGI